MMGKTGLERLERLYYLAKLVRLDRLALLVILVTLTAPASAQNDRSAVTDSVMKHVVSHLLPGNNRLLCPLPYYDCLNYDRTSLRFPAGRAAQDAFYEKLDSLLLFHCRNVNLWHVGGSHVQADFFSHRMRSNLTDMQPGNLGVRGILFPFGMANTNWNHNYRMEYTGDWTAGRNIQRDAAFDFGISGIAASTTDSLATLTLVLNMGMTPTWSFCRLRVMGYASSKAVLPLIARDTRISSLSSQTIQTRDTIFARVDSVYGGWVLPLGEMCDSVTVSFRIPKGETFTLTGLIPENDLTGISYYSSGINGAAVPTWLRCPYLARDLGLVRPDLVVFAIGVNDAAVPYGEFNVEAFKNGYRNLIRMVEAVSPGCAYIFITNNDTYRRESRRVKRANRNAPLVQKAFYELAEEYGGAVWDVFDFMGGLDSSPRWRDAGLMATDLIHFTRTGYELLGDLLYNAIIEDYMKRNVITE